jgi:hypothetical protein
MQVVPKAMPPLTHSNKRAIFPHLYALRPPEHNTRKKHYHHSKGANTYNKLTQAHLTPRFRSIHQPAMQPEGCLEELKTLGRAENLACVLINVYSLPLAKAKNVGTLRIIIYLNTLNTLTLSESSLDLGLQLVKRQSLGSNLSNVEVLTLHGTRNLLLEDKQCSREAGYRDDNTQWDGQPNMSLLNKLFHSSAKVEQRYKIFLLCVP